MTRKRGWTLGQIVSLLEADGRVARDPQGQPIKGEVVVHAYPDGVGGWKRNLTVVPIGTSGVKQSVVEGQLGKKEAEPRGMSGVAPEDDSEDRARKRLGLEDD